MSPKARAKLEQWLTSVWYQNKPIGPLAQLGLRLLRLTYQSLLIINRTTRKATLSKHPFSRAKKPLVLVIGNLIAGGTGKTPIVQAVCKHFQSKGLQVGIISRGYGRQQTKPLMVSPHTPQINPAELGDEPSLLAQQTGCPIAVGQNRQEALELLLMAHPDLDLVVSDDGLQHHRLARHVEWVVFDKRAAGNGQLLPEGPLREPLTRLTLVEAVLSNGLSTQQLASALQLSPQTHWHEVHVSLSGFRRKTDDAFMSVEQARKTWDGLKIVAFAGLGNPQKFFDTLYLAGFQCTRTLGLADHFDYPERYDSQFPEEIILTTGKDAVKLNAVNPKLWVAEVCVQLPTPLIQPLEDHLGLTTD